MPATKMKNRAIRENKPTEAFSAAIRETACKLWEEGFKQPIPKKIKIKQ